MRENILKKKLGVPVSPTSLSEEATPTDESGKGAVTAAAKSSTKHVPSPSTQSHSSVALAASAPPTTTASNSSKRRVSSTLSHGDSTEDQYGLSQLFQPDNAPKPHPGVGSAELSAVKEEPGVVKTEGNTFRTKFKVSLIRSVPVVEDGSYGRELYVLAAVCGCWLGAAPL